MTNLVASWIQRAIDQTVAGNGDWCVSATSNTKPGHWIQITWQHLNLAFPCYCDPNEVIAKLPKIPHLEIVSCEPNAYLTLAHSADGSLPMLAEFVVMYTELFLKDPVTEDWTTKEEEL